MPIEAHPGEHYTIRRKVFTIFGQKFHIYDRHGCLIGYCRRKAFRLREELCFYTDESCSKQLLTINARSIIDFGATYDIRPTGDPNPVASFRRRGLRSTFVSDSWSVMDSAEREIATLDEEGGSLAVMRRWFDFVAFFFPQTYTLRRVGGPALASLRVHFNPFVYRLSIAILADDNEIDDVVVLAGGCIIAAIEGRQTSG